MEYKSRKAIGILVRNSIKSNANVSLKAMHPNVRLYARDAEGVYPSSYNGKPLGLSLGHLEYIIMDLEDQLNINFDVDGGWRDSATYKDTLIAYTKETRLHHLIDYVYSEYNKKVKENKDLAETTEENFDINVLNNLYIIRLRKNGRDLFVANIPDDDDSPHYCWRDSVSGGYLFTSAEIEAIFDLNNDDVVNTAKPDKLSDLLKTLNAPYELYFIEFGVKNTEHWTYDEEDRVNQILDKLSPEEAKLIRSRLA